jgi:hypothetical protein
MGSNIEPREASTCETHTSSPARRSSNERAASFVFEGASRWVAYKEFRRAIGSRGYFEALRESKNPPRFVVLLEDSVALIGPAIALAGTFAAVQWQAPVLDGLASIAIGVLLAATASLMARETKYLRIGVPAHPAIAPLPRLRGAGCPFRRGKRRVRCWHDPDLKRCSLLCRCWRK